MCLVFLKAKMLSKDNIVNTIIIVGNLKPPKKQNGFVLYFTTFYTQIFFFLPQPCHKIIVYFASLFDILAPPNHLLNQSNNNKKKNRA